jgi:hypothetical protein
MHGVMVSFIVECRDYSQPKPFFRHAQRHIRADADALDVWTYSRSPCRKARNDYDAPSSHITIGSNAYAAKSDSPNSPVAPRKIHFCRRSLAASAMSHWDTTLSRHHA